ncbi:hypothetical protein FACS1894132_11470 [Clostridia bacterium]|nr:hypothetical protein FACS1894132_11470 [Clostridia bacterium]
MKKSKSFISVLLAVVMAILVITTTFVPLMVNGAGLSDANIKTVQNEFAKTNGDFDGVNGQQCVDFTKWFINKYTSLNYSSGNGNAQAYNTYNVNKSKLSSPTPTPNGVSVFSVAANTKAWGSTGTSAGHTGIVVSVDTANKKVQVLHTWNALAKGTAKLSTYSYPTNGVTFTYIGDYLKGITPSTPDNDFTALTITDSGIAKSNFAYGEIVKVQYKNANFVGDFEIWLSHNGNRYRAYRGEGVRAGEQGFGIAPYFTSPHIIEPGHYDVDVIAYPQNSGGNGIVKTLSFEYAQPAFTETPVRGDRIVANNGTKLNVYSDKTSTSTKLGTVDSGTIVYVEKRITNNTNGEQMAKILRYDNNGFSFNVANGSNQPAQYVDWTKLSSTTTVDLGGGEDKNYFLGDKINISWSTLGVTATAETHIRVKLVTTTEDGPDSDGPLLLDEKVKATDGSFEMSYNDPSYIGKYLKIWADVAGAQSTVFAQIQVPKPNYSVYDKDGNVTDKLIIGEKYSIKIDNPLKNITYWVRLIQLNDGVPPLRYGGNETLDSDYIIYDNRGNNSDGPTTPETEYFIEPDPTKLKGSRWVKIYVLAVLDGKTTSFSQYIETTLPQPTITVPENINMDEDVKIKIDNAKYAENLSLIVKVLNEAPTEETADNNSLGEVVIPLKKINNVDEYTIKLSDYNIKPNQYLKISLAANSDSQQIWAAPQYVHINKIDISKAIVIVNKTEFLYTPTKNIGGVPQSGVQKPVVESVVLDGKTLEIGKDYDVESIDSVEPGYYVLTVVGINSYDGNIDISYEIICNYFRFSEDQIILPYTGKEQTLNVDVFDKDNNKLKLGTDYEISRIIFENEEVSEEVSAVKDEGFYYVEFVGKGSYESYLGSVVVAVGVENPFPIYPVYGDIDLDGEIGKIADVVLLGKHVAGKITLTGQSLINANVDTRDPAVNVADLQALIKFMLKQISELPFNG